MKEFIVKYESDGDVCVAVNSANKIFSTMDMNDCYDIHILDIRQFSVEDFCEPCDFYGTWSNFSDPLRMEIRRKRDGEVVAVGYGSDH